MSVVAVTVAFIAGLVAGACAVTVGLSKDRKRIDNSRRELAKDWLTLWKHRAEIDKREDSLRERFGGAYQGRAS